MDLLRRRTEEDRQEKRRRQHAGHDDVHDVERLPASEEDGEGDVGEASIGTAFEEELVSRHRRRQDLPLAVSVPSQSNAG